MPNRIALRTALFAAVLLAAQLTFGSTTTYSDRLTFTADAAGPLTEESFETYAVGTIAVPYLATASGLVIGQPVGNNTVSIGNNSYGPPTDGNQNLLYLNGTTNFEATFSSGLMSAFGFDLSGFQPDTFGSGGFGVTLFNGPALVDSFFESVPTADFSGQFFGFINPAGFTTVEITITNPSLPGTSDYVGIDRIAFNHVPEPSTFVLAVVGLAGLGFVTLRKKLRRV